MLNGRKMNELIDIFLGIIIGFLIGITVLLFIFLGIIVGKLNYNQFKKLLILLFRQKE